MNNKIALLLPLLAVAAFSGCVTQRTAQFPGRDYDTVFKGAVKGLCKDPDLIVYQADKTSGEIRFQGRGLMIGAPDTAMMVANVGGAPQISMTLPGPNNPMVEQYIQAASAEIPSLAVTPQMQQAPQQNLDIEKQKLDLEKQKLDLEKQKFEFEKQKLRQK